MPYKMFAEEKLSQAGGKQASIGIKPLYPNTSDGFECNKNSIYELAVRISIKQKSRTRQVFAYRMLLSFKTEVICDFFQISRRKNMSVLKQISLDINQFFARHWTMSGGNIQACNIYWWQSVLLVWKSVVTEPFSTLTLRSKNESYVNLSFEKIYEVPL